MYFLQFYVVDEVWAFIFYNFRIRNKTEYTGPTGFKPIEENIL